MTTTAVATAAEETVAASPCMFVIRIDNGIGIRCVALAVAGSRFCAVHQPAVPPKRRRHVEREETV